MSDNSKVVGNIMNMIDQGKLFVEDGMLALKTHREMKKAGDRLVNKYGKGVKAADGIDNYYHPLLFCQLAQKGEDSRRNGKIIGLGKEIWDIHAKTDLSKENAVDKFLIDLWDSAKDLTNNAYGDTMGKRYPNIDCRVLLDHLRTENMRNEGIR